MFCDLVGSTELAARLDPEDLREVMRRLPGRAARGELSASRAMSPSSWATACSPTSAGRRRTRTTPSGRCAPGSQLVEAVGRLSGRTARRWRRGSASRPAWSWSATWSARARRGSEAVVGETPNLAARLQALAAPGTVVISQATRRLVGGLFELDDLGPQRSRASPSRVARLAGRGRGPAEGRFEARQTAGPDAAGRPRAGDRAAAASAGGRPRTARARSCCSPASPASASRASSATLRERLGDEPHMRLRYHCSPLPHRPALCIR